jgi:hypothetical protein
MIQSFCNPKKTMVQSKKQFAGRSRFDWQVCCRSGVQHATFLPKKKARLCGGL